MKVKNIVRKAVALGSGAVIGGASLMGALAYDLSTYPAKYIVDGQFDGTIVVGENAATADVLGSIDIAASLQAASVSSVPIEGGATTVQLSGDAFELSTGADRVELREPIGNVVESVTADNLAGLKSGKITTSKGTTGYTQFIRLQDNAALQDIAVNYVKNEGERTEVMADYLVIDAADQAFLQWEIQFDQGLKSEITDAEANNLEDRSFNIMGTDFTIVKTDVTTASQTVAMTLMGGSVPDTLREGETKTYTINGVDYEVTLVFVSDPNQGTTQAKFSVNGELTDAMGEGETETLSGGLQIGVRDVLVNAREGVASFFLGAHKIVLTDTNYTVADFGGSIEINDDTTESSVLDIAASYASATNRFEITSIKYQVRLESVEGAGGIAFIPAGKGAREFMDEPELLISDSLDLYYGGLTEVDSRDVKFSPVGDTRYTLSFTNIQGKEYNSVPFLSGKTSFHFGANDYNLEYSEGYLNASTQVGNVYNIGVNEYFILSKERSDDEKAVTNVLRYRDYDDSKRTLEFEDLAGGTIRTVVDATTRRGTLNVGGTSYTVEVNDTDLRDAPIFVDLNADDVFTDSDTVTITTWGGLVISWTAPASNSTTFTASMTQDQFDTSTADEEFSWTVTKEGGSSEDLDLDFDSGSYTGPLNTSGSTVTEFQFDEVESDSEKSVGMTDYGILITETNPDTSSDPNTLVLSVPAQQRFAQVFVTLGDVTATTGGAGSSQKVNPIAVGLAVLDSDAPAIGTDNLIVVGGPCANTVAAELLGNPAQCGAGFEPGKAVIKSWDKNGKVAILVAGYEATETLGASRVLAAYDAYDLKGTEVEVVVADLNSISVKPAQ